MPGTSDWYIRRMLSVVAYVARILVLVHALTRARLFVYRFVLFFWDSAPNRGSALYPKYTDAQKQLKAALTASPSLTILSCIFEANSWIWWPSVAW